MNSLWHSFIMMMNETTLETINIPIPPVTYLLSGRK